MRYFNKKLFIGKPTVFIFLSISISIFGLIKAYTNFKQSKKLYEIPNSYTYEILSSDNKIISRLSRKFSIFDNEDLIPSSLVNAFISSEDRRFFEHNGYDLIGLIRALRNNLKSGSIKEGGSTITQQVARLIFLNNELNIQRKINELLISLFLEIKYSKNQILKIYLNNIYLGAGAYGINEASQVYFGKLIPELTLSEIALLAGLAPAPSIYSPYENFDLAIKNRNKVLSLMYINGYISRNNYDKALAEKITLHDNDGKGEFLKDKVLVNFILNEADRIIKSTKSFKTQKHLIIKTSINKRWQNIAQNLSLLAYPNEIEFALLSIESNNGFIRAFVSGKKNNINEFNRVSSAIRPLGSTFKIIPYVAALSNGFNLNDIFNDVETCWQDYCPKNFSNRYYGEISLLDSFKVSSNIVPIKITEELGFIKIIDFANKFGLGYKQKLEPSYPLAIGAYGDSLFNITNAFATLNNNGRFLKAQIIEEIKSRNNKHIVKNLAVPILIISPEVASKANIMLEKVVLEGSGVAAKIKGEKILGKTGTSDKNRDLWFIGSTRKNTTGIWLGFDNNGETKLSSGSAAYLWKLFISEIYKLKID